MTPNPDAIPTNPAVQTNIQGDVGLDGGLANIGMIDTHGGAVIGSALNTELLSVTIQETLTLEE